MCGICGFIDRSSDPARAEELLNRMARSLDHRGPDDRRCWLSDDRTVGLGHTRLSIIDLAGGGQPMRTADGRYTIVFNGEIFNFLDLRKQLQAEGHGFATRSDTEVLLVAYTAWGPAMLEKLDGMFALAIHDSRAGSVFLARDRTGIKPLYYHAAAGRFVFGSEIKAVLEDPTVPRRLDDRALLDFMVLGYPVGPATFFKDIREMLPGTWLRIGADGTETRTFWRWRRDVQQDFDEADALEQTRDVLTRTLEEHLVSDVPLGVFLSGGIDSSLVVALLARELDRDIEAFTVRFDEAAYDESPYAVAVAKALGVKRHRLVTADAKTLALDLVAQVVMHHDQPFADSSSLPTYLVCQEMRKHVKVVIGGDGGDEMFGGYDRFRHADVIQRVGTCPGSLLRAAGSLCSPLRLVAPDRFRGANKFLAAALDRTPGRIVRMTAYCAYDALADVLVPSVLDRADGYLPSFPGIGRKDCGAEDLADATVTYALPGDYLRKVDCMSSRHGLEVRVPLLGKRVLELCARLPQRLKYSRSSGKLLLRGLLARYLDPEMFRRPKRGFGIPLDSVFGHRDREEICAMISGPDARISGLVRGDFVAALAEGFRTRRWDRSRWSRYGVYQQVYMLWSLELWLRRWNASY